MGDLEKLKTSRSNQGGWITRTINQFEDNRNSVSALEVLKDRLSGRIKKLNTAHDVYVAAIGDDNDAVEEAEDWLEKYVNATTKCLREIDERIIEIKIEQRTRIVAPLEDPSTPGDAVTPVAPPANAENTSNVTSDASAVPVDSSNLSSADTPMPSSSSVNSGLESPAAQEPARQQVLDLGPQIAPFANSPVLNSLDSWIDDLVIGQETINRNLPSSGELTLQDFARLQVERDLPKVELPSFDGSPIAWPKFIEQFHVQVHARTGLDDTRRMDLLQSHVKDEAKKIIHGLGYTGRNYALALKELKFAFGHRVSVARAYIDSITAGNILPSGDPHALRNFYVAIRDCIATLRQMQYTTELTSMDVLQRTTRRIPGDKRVKWNDCVRNICRTREPNLLDLERWLKECIESEFSPFAIPVRQRQNPPSFSKPHTTMNTAATPSVNSHNSVSCSLCSNDHHLSRCKDYLDKTPEERYELVKQHRLCFNCLHSKHRIADCKSKGTCRVSGCNVRHHTTLHRRNANTVRSNAIGQVHNTHHEQTVYFQVLPVIVKGMNGVKIETFAMLDSCSDISLINADLAKDIGLRGNSEKLTLNTLSSPVSLNSSRVSFSVWAKDDPGAEILSVKEAWTYPGIFKCPKIKASDLQHISHLRNLGINDVSPNQVKLLIGANVPKAHLQTDSREGPVEGPIAVQTILGWCILGGLAGRSLEATQANVNFAMHEDSQLSQQVEKFWATESFGVTSDFKKPTSVEDQHSLEVLEKHTREVDGHYEVPMLWRNRDKGMPDNKIMAENRFESLMRRLSRNLVMKDKYSAVMNGYISNGFARKLTPAEIRSSPDRLWYLPHHYVTNPNKPDKLRVVFDAAAKTRNVSLNSELMTGPDLTNNLFTVIQQFRLNPIAIVADVTEMFHQVRVSPCDTDALRFLWKEDLEDTGPPHTYKMLVHIFGAKDSPCCVNYALRKAALEEGTSELAKSTILSNFYVDDMLKSVQDVPTAIKLIDDVSETLSLKGFRLAKWMSSSHEVLAHISHSVETKTELDLDLDALPTQRVLGLGWDVKQDCFVFKPTNVSKPMTKRAIVSTVSSIYDPCGFLAPFTFRAKCLIQEVWRGGTNWDEIVSETLQEQWKNWLGELHYLSKLQIPRYHGLTDKMAVQLHVFSDASESGFAAVAYLRMVSSTGIYCSFVASKSHVAPLKQTLTIPKLELQGAVMAVRLSCSLKDTFGSLQVNYWTDAITVLRYLNNDSKRWKIFIANRVTEIREHSDPHQWRYVSSVQNPADDATRGLSAAVLSQANRWLLGPSFLWQDEHSWTSQPEIGPPPDDDDGIRKSGVCLNTYSALKNGAQHFNIEHVCKPEEFSSWYKLCRFVAWILRAAVNFCATLPSKNTIPILNEHLQPSELQNSEICLARHAQREIFGKEYDALQQGVQIDERSQIRSLDPFYDPSSGVLRVGGRLSRATLEEEFKHQILLPYDHQVSKLIVKDVHDKLAHCGPEHLVASVRQRFWIIKCRQLAKKVINECFDCLRRSVKPVVPLMADLPLQRVAGNTRPFQYTGLDYFGPMQVKRARSRLKKWGCIFTCLVTRSVHLELADSLQTDDFILVLRCFVSRRGHPNEIFSDNGTNFKGADKELRDSLQQLDQERVSDFLLQRFTKWNFIPPHAPHFGGVWERLVRSVKTALKAVLKEQVVSESVLRTTLAEVEAVLNSRPLTYNSSDVNDLTALTPNHFLHGGASPVAPIGEFDPGEIDSRKRWRQCQVLADHVWNRWKREYLPSLTVRNKWKHEVRNLKVDDLVILVDDNLPRGQWMLGRVIEIYPSEDGRIRSVKVKTSQGLYVRPASKICFLEECYK
jgi:hypothetical protein